MSTEKDRKAAYRFVVEAIDAALPSNPSRETYAEVLEIRDAMAAAGAMAATIEATIEEVMARTGTVNGKHNS